jgi:hypothetical protein
MVIVRILHSLKTGFTESANGRLADVVVIESRIAGDLVGRSSRTGPERPRKVAPLVKARPCRPDEGVDPHEAPADHDGIISDRFSGLIGIGRVVAFIQHTQRAYPTKVGIV